MNIKVTVISLHSVFWFNSYYRGFKKKFRHRQQLFLHSEIPWHWQELLVTKTELLNHSSLRKYQQWINLATKWLFVMSALEKKSQTWKDNASVDFCHSVPNVEMLKPTTATFFFSSYWLFTVGIAIKVSKLIYTHSFLLQLKYLLQQTWNQNWLLQTCIIIIIIFFFFTDAALFCLLSTELKYCTVNTD